MTDPGTLTRAMAAGIDEITVRVGLYGDGFKEPVNFVAIAKHRDRTRKWLICQGPDPDMCLLDVLARAAAELAPTPIEDIFG